MTRADQGVGGTGGASRRSDSVFALENVPRGPCSSSRTRWGWGSTGGWPPPPRREGARLPDQLRVPESQEVGQPGTGGRWGGGEVGACPLPRGFGKLPPCPAVGLPGRPNARGCSGTPALAPPGPSAAAWQPGSWRLPKICCLGLFVLLQPGAEIYFFKTSHLPTPSNLFCASLGLILSYVSVALGRLRAGSPSSPPRAPPPVKVAVTSCSPRAWGGRPPGLKEAASGRAAGRSEACGWPAASGC